MRTMSGSPCFHYGCSNRNSFGYCNTTVCINEHYQQEQWGLPSTTNKSESVVKKLITNADRIRSMTDDELADEYIRIYRELPKYSDSWAWLREWLKQEVDNE